MREDKKMAILALRTKHAEQVINQLVELKLKEEEQIIEKLYAGNENYKRLFLENERKMWDYIIVNKFKLHQLKQKFEKWPTANFVLVNQGYQARKYKLQMWSAIFFCVVFYVIYSYSNIELNAINSLIFLLISFLNIKFGSKLSIILEEMILTGVGFPGIKAIFKLDGLGYNDLMVIDRKANIENLKEKINSKETAIPLPKYFLSEDGKNILTREEKEAEQREKTKNKD